MKTLFILLVVIAVIPFTGSAADAAGSSPECYLDWQYSVRVLRRSEFVEKPTHAFRQMAGWVVYEDASGQKRYVVPDFFLYQSRKDGDTTNSGEAAMGGFVKPWIRNHFSLTVGGYILFNNEEGIYLLPSISPELSIWRFRFKVFYLQYVPIRPEKQKWQYVVFPAEAYVRLGKISLPFGYVDTEFGFWGTAYRAEGMNDWDTQAGPSVIAEHDWGKTQVHFLYKKQEMTWVIYLKHTLPLHDFL